MGVDKNFIEWYSNAIAGQFFGISKNTEGQKTLWVLPLGRDKKFHLNDISEVDLSRNNLDELNPSELDEINKVFGTRFGKCFERESTADIIIDTVKTLKTKGREINLSKETQIALAYLNGHLGRIADALETIADNKK